MRILKLCLIAGTCLFLLSCGPARESTADTAASPGAALLNTFREREGRRPVKLQPQLQAAAQAHADDMLAKGYFSHQSPSGGTLVDRVRLQGYDYCRIAENIGKGYTSLPAAMAGWENSPGHRANMLLKDVTEFGLAQRGTGANAYWVMVLGQPGC